MESTAAYSQSLFAMRAAAAAVAATVAQQQQVRRSSCRHGQSCQIFLVQHTKTEK
jgi:hypothetical protein